MTIIQTPSSRQNRNSPLFGSHMSVAGGYHNAVTAAHAVGFETVQLFTKNNNQWKAPPITPEHVHAFRSRLAETGITLPISHASYLINLGSPDDALWRKSIEAMAVEVERCQALGIGDVVAKCLGSRNPHNMVKATFAALQQCASPRSVANRRGKKVSDLLGRRDAAPAQEGADA